MTTQDLRDQINKVVGSGYGDWRGDVALKVYFYPMSSALFTDDEWEQLIEEDEITVRAEWVEWVVEQMGARLGQVVRAMRLEMVYLSVIVYGGVGIDATLLYDIGEDGTVYAARVPEGTNVQIAANNNS